MGPPSSSICVGSGQETESVFKGKIVNTLATDGTGVLLFLTTAPDSETPLSIQHDFAGNKG